MCRPFPIRSSLEFMDRKTEERALQVSLSSPLGRGCEFSKVPLKFKPPGPGPGHLLPCPAASWLKLAEEGGIPAGMT